MSRRRRKKPVVLMRTVGTLKLSDEDAAEYKKALEFYEIERSGAFLRRCAYALIKHYKSGDELPARLSFKLPKNPKPPKE